MFPQIIERKLHYFRLLNCISNPAILVRNVIKKQGRCNRFCFLLHAPQLSKVDASHFYCPKKQINTWTPLNTTRENIKNGRDGRSRKPFKCFKSLTEMPDGMGNHWWGKRQKTQPGIELVRHVEGLSDDDHFTTGSDATRSKKHVQTLPMLITLCVRIQIGDLGNISPYARFAYALSPYATEKCVQWTGNN